jgi:hypothetical protein
MPNEIRVGWFCFWAVQCMYNTVHTIAALVTHNAFGVFFLSLLALMTGWCASDYLKEDCLEEL